MANVGSVGQPGDREPEACYVIDSRERKVFSFQRVACEMARTQNVIGAECTPARHGPWRRITGIMQQDSPDPFSAPTHRGWHNLVEVLPLVSGVTRAMME